MITSDDLKRGTQIIYVPAHANGDPDHPDCVAGFVTSVQAGFVFCRYWRRDLVDLRTKANSERTPVCALVVKDSVPQKRVKWMLKKYC